MGGGGGGEKGRQEKDQGCGSCQRRLTAASSILGPMIWGDVGLQTFALQRYGGESRSGGERGRGEEKEEKEEGEWSGVWVNQPQRP